MTAGTWVLERCSGDRFPYRLRILDAAGATALRLRVQDSWPSANRNIFCLRDEVSDGGDPGEEIERVPIIALQRRGVRLSVVLDRRSRRRCDFLFLRREYKQRPGESHEQIYWQTQASMTQRRPKVVPSVLRRKINMTIAVDSRERYPWRFAGSTVLRRRLASGDYALLDGEDPVAVVERKTFENMLADFGVMPLLHQRLLELAAHEHSALVVEAPYEAFLNPAKVHHYSSSFCAAAIADLHARYPRLQLVFCANRKTANLWTASYFAAVHALPKGGD